jgi:uncharacterized Ntn-hydrolase superfamily protein
MTFSIVARCERTGRIGIAVATRAFAVGARVPHIRTGAGAVATQATTNQLLGPRGLDLLASGVPAEACLAALLATDPGRDHRQVHVMDRHGRSAAHTGLACVPWCGHVTGRGFSVAGNMLAGEAVVRETARAFADATDIPFARRLIAALKAGEAAGGDKRGRQSAALLVHDDEPHAALDLRVDDHADPLAELSRLEAVARDLFVHTRRIGARRDDPAGLLDEAERQAAIARSRAEGYE